MFDCETTTDPSQRLLFGSFAHYVDRAGDPACTTLVTEGVFYADDLCERDPEAFDQLREYCQTNRADTAPGRSRELRLLPRSEFVEEYLYRQGYRNKAAIVGHNLVFDLARLALIASPARKNYRGGFSLSLWQHEGGEHPFRPRIRIRSFDSGRSWIGFGRTSDREVHHNRGNFIDTMTAAAAYTDRSRLSLEAACEAFGIDFEKRPAEHGVVTDDYINYCREDTAATARLYQALTIEHGRHGVDRRLASIYSSASVGKAVLAKMGLGPTASRFPEFPHDVCGIGMEAFYGGRSECGIRNVEVPVTYVDFLSMYLTCNALTGTWKILTADHLQLVNTTAQVRALLADPDLLERCFDREDVWPMLHTLVKVDPNGARFPTRARYREGHTTFNTGHNPLTSTRPIWYSLGDVIAATLLDGPDPIVHHAWQLAPEGTNPDLRPVKLRGEVDFDPHREDLFQVLPEQRQAAKRDDDLPAEKRERLSRFLKVMGNSVGFGIYVQLDRDDSPAKPVAVDVYTGESEPFRTTTRSLERPGDYCLPPVAAAVCGAARLMLALLERTVTDAGGTYAFCDTDSMAIVSTRTGRPPRNHPDDIGVLSWEQVDNIRARFDQLHPYDRNLVTEPVLKIEDENYTRTRRRRQLRCFAISAKRYQLTDERRRPVKSSEHGLGHLLNPTNGSSKQFIEQAWAYLRNPEASDWDWLDRPAASQLAVTSTTALRWFEHMNSGLTYVDSIKPYSFMLVTYPDPLDPAAAAGVHPIAPFSRNAEDWVALDWVDRRTGQPITVRTEPLDGIIRPGTVRVRTYRDVLDRYRLHPEAPALDSAHDKVTRTSVGRLRRRPVSCLGPVAYLGKESNDLHQRALGLSDRPGEEIYTCDETDFVRCVLPVLKQLRTSDVARHAGVTVRTIQRVCAERTKPGAALRRDLTKAAVDLLHPTGEGSRSPDALLHLVEIAGRREHGD